MRDLHRSILLCALALLAPAATASATPLSSDVAPTHASCNGLSDEDQGRALFGDRFEVLGARALRTSSGKPLEPRTMGAELYIRAEHGVTAAYVQRLATCQVARYRAAAVAGAETDPLAVEGARVHVRPNGAGYVVRISSDRRSAARAIIARAEALAAR